ncbi:MAG TPA: SAM-dependent chlorinase/fluorinase [Casimicrobiaceae bacterium]|nr:SAM-dependent chlorinase/fluorinase [Casimicrobiaceae bacterium]
MIALFTDFGAHDIYVAQMKAALLARNPAATILDLLHSVPAFRVQSAAHLLAAVQAPFPAGTIFVAVVDPGVGTPRRAAVVRADDKWYLGPDNGLLSVLAARAARRTVWHVAWAPPRLSPSFHGRDLFAPLAAMIATGELPADALSEVTQLDVVLASDDLAEIIYIDHYGNAMTGLRGSMVRDDVVIRLRDAELFHARVFADVPVGTAFWYVNSIGLVEIAANRASAAKLMDIDIGNAVEMLGG